MKKLLFLILLGFCLSSPTYADGWVIIDTVGIVNIEIDVDYSDRTEQQLTKVARKVHKIAKKLNKQAMHDHIFQNIHLYETGINGRISIGGKFKMEEDPPRLIGLSILIPTELFSEEMVMKLYRYGVLIKEKLYSELPENLSGSNLIERIETLP